MRTSVRPNCAAVGCARGACPPGQRIPVFCLARCSHGRMRGTVGQDWALCGSLCGQECQRKRAKACSFSEEDRILRASERGRTFAMERISRFCHVEASLSCAMTTPIFCSGGDVPSSLQGGRDSIAVALPATPGALISTVRHRVSPSNEYPLTGTCAEQPSSTCQKNRTIVRAISGAPSPPGVHSIAQQHMRHRRLHDSIKRHQTTRMR